MNNRNLDELLRSYAARPVPPLPGSFSQDVLREIRLRKQNFPLGLSWLSEVCTTFFRPGLLAACFALTITISFGVPALMRPPAHALAVSALGLDVFSSSTSHMPSGLLAKVL